MSGLLREQELALVGYLVREPGLLLTHAERLREYHFEYPNAAALFNLVAGSVRRHGRAPTLAESERILRQLSGNVGWELDRLQLGLEDLRLLYEVDVSPASGKMLHDYVVRREAAAIARELTERSPEELVSRLSLLRDRLEGLREDQGELEDLGISLLSEEGIQAATGLVDDLYGKAPVPSGWSHLDRFLLGGYRPGEVSVFLGVTGRGKSLSLINMARNMVWSGRRVVYYAMDNPLAEMAERIYASVCDMPIEAERVLSDYRRDIVTGLGGRSNDLFWLKVWPPGRKRVADMRAHYLRLVEALRVRDLRAGVPEDRAGVIDAVLADYGTLFMTERKREAYRLEVGETFQELVSVSREIERPIITAHQGNRPALTQDRIGLENVGEALAALQPVANVFGLGRSKAEKRKGEMCLDLLKMRRPEAEGWRLFLKVDTRRQRMWENPEKVPVPIEGWGDDDEDPESPGDAPKKASRKVKTEEGGELPFFDFGADAEIALG